MLKKLINLIEYLPSIAPSVLIVANEKAGTTALNSPGLHGRQIVAVLPLAMLDGNVDNLTGAHAVMIFVLEKSFSASGTPERIHAQYLDCARALESIVIRLADDMVSARGEQCPLLAGFSLQELQIAPEAGVFGGRDGFSATITLR